MKSTFLKTSILLLTAIFIASCSSSDSRDTEAPVIVLLTPTEGAKFEPGQTIHADIEFSDNKGLASFKIDIHYAGDGHTHGLRHGEHHAEWSYVYEGTLSGTFDDKHLHIHIPTEINGHPIKEGDYHFGVFAIDTSGNESIEWIEIEIEDDHHHHHHD